MKVKDIEIINEEYGIYSRLIISLDGIKSTLFNNNDIVESTINSGSVNDLVFALAKDIAHEQYKCNNIISIAYIERHLIDPAKNVNDSYAIDINRIKNGL